MKMSCPHIIGSEILWQSYRLIKEYLSKSKSGIKIYNATKGGLLDVFERVEYESVLDKRLI